MTTGNDQNCVIWQEYVANVERRGFESWVHKSDRAGGSYRIERNAELYLRDIADDGTRARLTSMLVDLRGLGEEYPLVNDDVIHNVETKRALPMHERAERLLRFLVSRTDIAGYPVIMSYSVKEQAMAWSESLQQREVYFFLEYLSNLGFVLQRGSGFVDEPRDDELNTNFQGYLVTVDGHSHVADSLQVADPSQAFVAMWFDPSVDGLYERGIKPAIEAAGYNPLRIDQKPDANKIDDEIIAEIRRSRFVVADFTHGDHGARGGVYYEAGFAYGLNIPVIFTCREDIIKKNQLHFDTRQYSHIDWQEPEDLVEPLEQRILARIGEGPNRQ